MSHNTLIGSTLLSTRSNTITFRMDKTLYLRSNFRGIKIICFSVVRSLFSYSNFTSLFICDSNTSITSIFILQFICVNNTILFSTLNILCYLCCQLLVIVLYSRKQYFHKTSILHNVFIKFKL